MKHFRFKITLSKSEKQIGSAGLFLGAAPFIFEMFV